jgi:hypothetical protein
MQSPRAPGAGITGTWISLDSNTSRFLLADTGSLFNDGRTRSAAALDREADVLLFIGRVDAAERLAHRAAEIRAVLV